MHVLYQSKLFTIHAIDPRLSLFRKKLSSKNLLNYIDAHIYDRITIKELAAYVQKHPTHITAEFKKALSQTIHTYINQRKIAEAKHLLLFTDKSYIKKSAPLLNFSSQSHFIQVFKQFEKLTPLEFKNKYVFPIFDR